MMKKEIDELSREPPFPVQNKKRALPRNAKVILIFRFSGQACFKKSFFLDVELKIDFAKKRRFAVLEIFSLKEIFEPF